MKYKEYIEIKEILDSKCIPRKIMEYSNHRIAPKGIMSMNDRLKDGWERYKKRQIEAGIDISEDEKNYMHRKDLCNQLEEWLQKNTSIDLSKITDSNLESNYELLQNWKVIG